MDHDSDRELEAAARRRWSEVVGIIDRLVERVQTQGEWRTNPKSALAIDDIHTAPHQTSHAFQLLLSAGIDNLNGIRHLIFGRPDEDLRQVILLQAAHFVLARCAIENFATALWLLGPEDRGERVENTLRWHVRNINDEHAALDRFGAGVAGDRTKSIKVEELEEKLRASSRPVPDRFRAGYWSESVVKYADNYEGLTGKAISNELIWRLCSGFAHGRPWASLGFLDRELVATDDPDVFEARMTSDLTRSVVAPDRAIHLCAALLRRHERLNIPILQ